jgi:hypothetical protein
MSYHEDFPDFMKRTLNPKAMQVRLPVWLKRLDIVQESLIDLGINCIIADLPKDGSYTQQVDGKTYSPTTFSMEVVTSALDEEARAHVFVQAVLQAIYTLIRGSKFRGRTRPFVTLFPMQEMKWPEGFDHLKDIKPRTSGPYALYGNVSLLVVRGDNHEIVFKEPAHLAKP